MHSGVHQAVAADTPEPLDNNPATMASYAAGFITLDPGATGPAVVGGPEVSVANFIGTPIQPGQTILLPPTGAPGQYTTQRTFIAFTSNAAGADRVAFTVVN